MCVRERERKRARTLNKEPRFMRPSEGFVWNFLVSHFFLFLFSFFFFFFLICCIVLLFVFLVFEKAKKLERLTVGFNVVLEMSREILLLLERSMA